MLLPPSNPVPSTDLHGSIWCYISTKMLSSAAFSTQTSTQLYVIEGLYVRNIFLMAKLELCIRLEESHKPL
nr:hypothetical protein CFP56_34263 [Quercus suber]